MNNNYRGRMKVLIICISVHHGNTEKIAKAMAEILDAEILKPNEVDINTLQEYDLIGFGSGIYFSRHHKALFELAARMPIMENKNTFIFSTRGIGSVWFYHRPLKKKLLEKKVNIAGEFSCRGLDTVGPFKLIGGMNKGRPGEIDLANAKTFASELKNTRKFHSHKDTENTKKEDEEEKQCR